MKKVLLKLLNNHFALLWFGLGLAFFVLATKYIYEENFDRCLGCIGIALACHGRSEIKILQERIVKDEYDITTAGET